MLLNRIEDKCFICLFLIFICWLLLLLKKTKHNVLLELFKLLKSVNNNKKTEYKQHDSVFKTL